MNKKFVFYLLIFILSALSLAAIFPYPITSNYTNINEIDAYKINNYNETELTPLNQSEKKLLDLDFEAISVLLPTQFEIIDIESKETYLAQKIGIKNHVEIIMDENSKETLLETIGNFSWKRRPVLVKLNSNAFLPASLACYPHGYKEHFCLHFKNSKTHGTKKYDHYHQKNIEIAKSKSKQLVK